MRKKILALTTFSGTIIGVGLFSLPFVTAQIGFIPMFFYFIILGAVVMMMHLLYGEIVTRTIGNHRLPGYSKIYLNKGTEFIAYVTTFIGLTGALLAYIIVGGEFLANLLIPIFGGTSLSYILIFFTAGTFLVYFGAGPISKTEFLSLGIFFTVLALLFFKALPHIELSNFTSISFDIKNYFLPYGVILFSLGGLAIIPEIKEILKSEEKSMKKIIIWGSVTPILAYIIFVITVFGVTGAATTKEGMIGLNLALGNGIVHLGFMFGILTTFTSFITLGVSLKKEFRYDLGLPAWLAWILACFPAIILFMLGFRQFINIIGFIGAVTMGIDITIISLIYLKARKKSQRIPSYQIKIPDFAVYILIVLFLVGVALQLVSL
ncbi:MAG: hypothetical protein CMI53_05740 [Parcubacteria group bacterium]|nr:hypothetical protein [Parcubacteria group bacterium]|tara:strand:+ start:893 stop:2026 length:1134 start_codon:yes stop_codon:yes gene_type:complete